MKITPNIFEAHLKCPMQCWLQAASEHASRNTYAEWVQTQTESYRVAEAKRLLTQIPSGEFVTSPCSSRGGGVYISTEDMKLAKWRLAIDVPLRVDESLQTCNSPRRETNASSEAGSQNVVTTASIKKEDVQCMVWVIEARLHAIERVPSEGRSKPTKLIPIRFAFRNKLDNDARMMLAFDALVLSKVLGRPIGLGKIIHGEEQATLKVKTFWMSTQVKNHIKKIIALLSGHSPPDLLLNRHCTECEFQDHCHKIATEKDVASRLQNVTD